MDGKVDHFTERGLYDGLFLLSDETTGTRWNHMTGEALYGPLVGKKLEVENVLHTTVEQALESDAGTLIAISTHPQAARRNQPGSTLARLLSGITSLNAMFKGTIAKEDDRRPTMEMGIGLWVDSLARYYPMSVVQAQGSVFDELAGRRVLVYFDPTARAMMALYSDAQSARWDDKVLRLSDGSRIERGVLHSADGARVEAVRPLQVFTRWYGFSLTFPKTEIYGQR